MRKFIRTTAVILLCAVFFTGCTAAAATENAAAISAVPQEAVLLYTHDADWESGSGVITDPWNNPDDVGFFVVEVVHQSGSMKNLNLNRQDGDAVASFGDISGNGIFITDILTDAAGDYVLYRGNVKKFYGVINVYFVPGIGYSLPE